MKKVKIIFNGDESEIPESDLDFFINEKGAELVEEKPNLSEDSKKKIYQKRVKELEPFKNSKELLKELSDETTEEEFQVIKELGEI